MLISLRQGPSSPAQRLRKATPGTYSKNSQKHSSSIVLDQQRRSAKTQNPTSLHRLLCWCTLIKQGIRAEGTGKSFTEAVTRTLAPTLLLRQTINLPLRRQPPCRVALLLRVAMVHGRARHRAMSSNAMRDAQLCWAGRFCERLWPFLVVKAASSAKIAPTQHNEGVNCDQLVGLLEPAAQPTHVFRPFFARSPKVLTKKFTWHPETSRRTASAPCCCAHWELVADGPGPCDRGRR